MPTAGLYHIRGGGRPTKVQDTQLMRSTELGPAWHDMWSVFTSHDGRPRDSSRVTPTFRKLANEADLSNVRLHDLRHSHASLMLQAEVHPKVVSERLGHASVNITLDTYGHVLFGVQEEAAERFAKLLGGLGGS